MRLFTITSVSALALLLAASPVHGQDRWSFEVRGGANVNSNQFATADLKTGIGFGGALGVRILPDLFAFGGWDWQHHGAKAPLFGVSAHVEDTGYAFGLRYVVPVPYRARPWVRAGGLYNHVEIEASADGVLVGDSKHTLGLETGGGLELALGNAWSLTPGLRYRRFEPTVRFGGVESSSTLSDVAFDGHDAEVLTSCSWSTDRHAHRSGYPAMDTLKPKYDLLGGTDMNLKETLEALAERLQTTGVRTIYGEPISAEGRTIIPVARVAYGFGGGGGQSGTQTVQSGDVNGEGEGGGGGVRAVPVGVVEITPEQTRFLRFDDWRPLAAAAIIGFALWVGASKWAGRRSRRD